MGCVRPGVGRIRSGRCRIPSRDEIDAFRGWDWSHPGMGWVCPGMGFMRSRSAIIRARGATIRAGAGGVYTGGRGIRAPGLTRRSPMPTLSICMVSLDCRRVIEPCLVSLRQSRFRDYEILVADNGSRDGTLEYLRAQSDVQLIENGWNAGVTKGTNQCNGASSGKEALSRTNHT